MDNEYERRFGSTIHVITGVRGGRYVIDLQGKRIYLDTASSSFIKWLRKKQVEEEMLLRKKPTKKSHVLVLSSELHEQKTAVPLKSPPSLPKSLPLLPLTLTSSSITHEKKSKEKKSTPLSLSLSSSSYQDLLLPLRDIVGTYMDAEELDRISAHDDIGRELLERDRKHCPNEICRIHLMNRLSGEHPLLSAVTNREKKKGEDDKIKKETKEEDFGEHTKLPSQCMSRCEDRLFYMTNSIIMLRNTPYHLHFTIEFHLGPELSELYGIPTLVWNVSVPGATRTYYSTAVTEKDILIGQIDVNMFSEYRPFPSTFNLDRLTKLFRHITQHLKHWRSIDYSFWPLLLKYKDINVTSIKGASIKDTFAELALIYLALAYTFTANGGSIVMETSRKNLRLVASFARVTSVVLGRDSNVTVREE